MKIRPAGAEFFHADKHDEANIRFPKFCERLKKANKINSSRFTFSPGEIDVKVFPKRLFHIDILTTFRQPKASIAISEW